MDIENIVFINTDTRLDVRIDKISSCNSHSLNECERDCAKYYSCDTAALANDLLVKIDVEC